MKKDSIRVKVSNTGHLPPGKFPGVIFPVAPPVPDISGRIWH
ncbi:hypothetical protein ACTJJB_30905 [Chitinophaga sp. 22536]